MKTTIKREQRQACSSLPSVNKLCKTAWAVTVGIILCGCLLFWPTSERACREGVAEAVTVSWYELGVPGGDTLYFNVLRTDSTLRGLSTECETAQREFRANAFFISYSGRLLTAADSVTRPERLNRETLLPALQKESRLVSVRLAGFRRMLEEMEYYGRTRLGIVGWGLFAGADYASADKRFTASVGVRADGADYSARMARFWRQLSPRASVSYQLVAEMLLATLVGLERQ